MILVLYQSLLLLLSLDLLWVLLIFKIKVTQMFDLSFFNKNKPESELETELSAKDVYLNLRNDFYVIGDLYHELPLPKGRGFLLQR